MRATTVTVVFAVFAVVVGSSVGWGVSASGARVEDSSDSFLTATNQDTPGPRFSVVPRNESLVKDRSKTYDTTIKIPSEFDGGLNLALHVWTTGEGAVDIAIPDRGAIPLPDRHYVPLYRNSPGTELSVRIDVSEAERVGDHTLHMELIYWNNDVQRRVHQTMPIEVVCPPGCQLRELYRWVSENLGIVIAFVALVVSILSLVFWFLGRENVRMKLERGEQ